MAVIAGFALVALSFAAGCYGAATAPHQGDACDAARQEVQARGFADSPLQQPQKGTQNQHVLSSFTTGYIDEASSQSPSVSVCSNLTLLEPQRELDQPVSIAQPLDQPSTPHLSQSPIGDLHSITEFSVASKGPICQESCCSEYLENKMYKSVGDSLVLYVKDSIGKVVTLIDTRARRFDEFFRQMMNHSRLEFHHMFERTYGKIYLENSEVFAEFFKELETYYAKGTVRLSETMESFFGILYQKMFTVLNQQYQFDDRYLGCVAENMVDMQPFGDVPKKLGVQLRRSFVATRTLYKALAKAASVANEMGSIRVNNACVKRTMRMQLCNACAGVSKRACSGYCTDIVANCFGSFAEVSQAWDAFVDAVEKVADRLAGPYDIEAVVEPLNIKISEAIMIFQEGGAKISEKIFQKCGKLPIQKRPKRKVDFKKAEDGPNMEVKLETMDGPKDGHAKKKNKKVQAKDDVPEFKKMLSDIKLKVKDTKQFWLQLPYQYCNDPNISASPGDNDRCWNGTAVGAYSRPEPSSPDLDGKPSSLVSEQIFVLRSFTDKLKKAFHGQEVEMVDDTEEVMAGSGSGSGDGDDDGEVEEEEERILEVEPDISPTTTTTDPPPVVHVMSNANRSTMSLPRALVQYLLPIAMVWFGGAIRDLL